MNIVVLMKQVPDTYAERKLSSSDNTLDREASDAVINEIDEYAIEEGLRLKEAHGGEVTILTMGPERAAEATGLPQLTGARKVTVDGSTVTVERVTDTGYDVVQAAMPAVLSVVEKINDPRYPSFKGIMAAKSKPVTTLTLAELGLAEDEVGLAAATTKVDSFELAPPR